MKLQEGAIRRTTRLLSGGNQQKLTLAKWIDPRLKVLLVDEPARGIDVGAKAEIFSLLDDLASRGLGIVMVSSELEEVAENSDRVFVIGGGEVICELEGRRDQPGCHHGDAVRARGPMTTPTAAVPENKGRRRAGFASNAREGSVFLLRYGMVFVLIVMVVVTIILDSSFLDKSNLLNLLLQWAPVGLMAIGMTYVIIAGGFDLSVGGIYAGAAVLYAGMANNGFPIVLAVLLALLAGVGAGIVNGTIITGLNVNAFVATLGTGFMLRGSGTRAYASGADRRHRIWVPIHRCWQVELLPDCRCSR